MGMWTIPEESNDSRFSKEELDDFVKVFAKAVYDKHLSIPVVMTLEMIRPISFISYSALVVLAPVLELIVDPVKMEKFQAVINDRKRIENLIVTIEELEKSDTDTTRKVETSEQR